MGDEKKRTTYVLQAPRQIDEVTAWVDVATIEVPANTRRKTAIRKALETWGGIVPEEGIGVRLIDSEGAEVVPVRPKPPEAPQLVIG